MIHLAETKAQVNIIHPINSKNINIISKLNMGKS
jgi:hypothetical protein